MVWPIYVPIMTNCGAAGYPKCAAHSGPKADACDRASRTIRVSCGSRQPMCGYLLMGVVLCIGRGTACEE